MLIDASYSIKDFMDFLNEKKLCSVPCKVVFLPDNDSVKGETGTGFAAYIPSSELMYVAGNLSELEEFTPEEQFEAILHSVAHEYIHHLQFVENREFNEDEADDWADELVKEYMEAKEAKRE